MKLHTILHTSFLWHDYIHIRTHGVSSVYQTHKPWGGGFMAQLKVTKCLQQNLLNCVSCTQNYIDTDFSVETIRPYVLLFSDQKKSWYCGKRNDPDKCSHPELFSVVLKSNVSILDINTCQWISGYSCCPFGCNDTYIQWLNKVKKHPVIRRMPKLLLRRWKHRLTLIGI